MTGDEKFQEFLDKMDHEGGIVEMLGWGGVRCFPEQLRPDAQIINDAVKRIESIIADLGYE